MSSLFRLIFHRVEEICFEVMDIYLMILRKSTLIDANFWGHFDPPFSFWLLGLVQSETCYSNEMCEEQSLNFFEL